jgi:hypothetical protein
MAIRSSENENAGLNFLQNQGLIFEFLFVFGIRNLLSLREHIHLRWWEGPDISLERAT